MEIPALVYLGVILLAIINSFRLPKKYERIMEKADRKLLERFNTIFSGKIPWKLDDATKQELLKDGYSEKNIVDTFIAAKVNGKKQIFYSGPKVAALLIVIALLEGIGSYFKGNNYIYIEAGIYLLIGIILLIFVRKNKENLK